MQAQGRAGRRRRANLWGTKSPSLCMKSHVGEEEGSGDTPRELGLFLRAGNSHPLRESQGPICLSHSGRPAVHTAPLTDERCERPRSPRTQEGPRAQQQIEAVCPFKGLTQSPLALCQAAPTSISRDGPDGRQGCGSPQDPRAQAARPPASRCQDTVPLKYQSPYNTCPVRRGCGAAPGTRRPQQGLPEGLSAALTDDRRRESRIYTRTSLNGVTYVSRLCAYQLVCKLHTSESSSF